MFVLELLGTLSLVGDSGPVPVTARQKRPLGLLAVLGLGGRQGLARDRIEAYFWPESSGELARHALDQTAYSIRRALGGDFLLSAGRELRLNPDVVEVDVWEFEAGIRAREWAVAVGRYGGRLLEGTHFAAGHELEAWIETERGRLQTAYHEAVERLADGATEAGDHPQSVAWCRRLATSDPLSARAARKLMLALAASGDRASAVKHARLYQGLVRQQLEMEPDSEIERLASTFSRPAGARLPASAPPATPVVPPPRSTGTRISRPVDAVLEAISPAPARPGPPRGRRSWIVAVVSLCVTTAILIGAVTLGSRGGRARPRAAGASADAVGARIPVPAARDLYLRALAAWSDGSQRGLDTAVVHLRRATELDHEYAEAYAALADAYVMLAYYGYRPSGETLPAAREAALRSIQLDSTLASPHPALAYALAWERNFAGADSEFRRAVALDPTHATAQASGLDPRFAAAHQWYAILLMILAQKPGASAAAWPAPDEDPFSLHAPVVEIPFTKWITTYPAIAGNTSYGPGTIAGEVLSRIDDGDVTHLVARYEVTDSSGGHAFKAVIQGRQNDAAGSAVLDGIVTWGWMTGAHVRVTFQRITPCQLAKLGVCFQGMIQMQRG